MLADREDIRERLLKFGKKFAVLGEFESITETPEYKRIYKITNRSRIRGLGGTVDKLWFSDFIAEFFSLKFSENFQRTFSSP